MSATIYTRTGDTGQTVLLGGARVYKDEPRVEAYATLDEGTCALGMARAATQYDDICRDIIDLQGELIPVMSEIALVPGGPKKVDIPHVEAAQVARLEQVIDRYNTEWIQTGQFVRPGGSQASAALDLARAIFRRAERRLITLHHMEPLNPELLKYVNRLSDLVYVLARIDEQRTIVDVVRRSLQDGGETAVSDLSLSDCDRIIEAGLQRAQEIDVPMVLAVVDRSGDVVESRRMDNALAISIELAPHKAYTAAAVRMPTDRLAELAQPGQALYSIDINVPRLTLIGGGIPLERNGRVVGAVGVSGGSVEQDIDVAQAMIAAF